jgi:hypothetical protein
MDIMDPQVQLAMLLATQMLVASWQPNPDDRNFQPLAIQRTDETKERVAYMQ